MRRLFVVLFWWLGVVLAAFLLSFLYPSASSAGVLRGNSENCSWLAKVMAEAAYHQSTGVTPQEIRDWMNAGISESMGKPLSIVGDEGDAKFVLEMMEEVLSMPSTKRHEVILRTVQKCMRGEV